MSLTAPEDPLWQTVWFGIGGFLERWQALTRERLDPEQFTAVFGLLHHFRNNVARPTGVADYGLHFGPLLSTGDEQRQLFDALWSDYWTETKVGEVQDDAEPPATPLATSRHRRISRRRKIAAAMLVAGLWLAAAGLGYHYYRVLKTPVLPPTIVEPPLKIETRDPTTKPSKAKTVGRPYLEDLPLREPPPALTLSGDDRRRLDQALYWVLGTAALVVALLLALIWWQRRLAFQALAGIADEADRQPLHLNAEAAGGELTPGYGALAARLRFADTGGKVIDWRKTLAATSRVGGFPALRYRVRRRQADFVLIADRRHRHDQAAWLLSALRKTLGDAQVGVRSYDFDHHPEWLWPEGRRDEKPLPFDRVIGRHAGSRLLLAVDSDVLCYRLSGGVQSWLKTLQPFPHYRLLLLNPPEMEQARQLAHGRFRYRSFGGLRDLAPLLDFEAPPDYPAQEASLLFTTTFREEWLGNRPPAELNAVFAWLLKIEARSSASVRRLLAVLSLYPALNGDLTLALYRHFAAAGAPEPCLKPADLINTVALPWCRRGRLPGWLRQALLASMPKDDYRHARQFFRTLFANSDAPKGRPIALELDKPVPLPRALWRLLFRIKQAKPGSALRDRIFARILLSPHNPFGRLSLPARLVNALPGVLLSQAGAGLLLVMAAAGTLAGTYGLWQWKGAGFYAARLFEKQWQRHRAFVVELRYNTPAQPLLTVVGKGLSALGYRVAYRLDETLTKNRVAAPAEAIDELTAVAGYMSFGGTFAVVTDPGLVRIDLAAMPQTGQVFSDVKKTAPSRTMPYPETVEWQSLAAVAQEENGIRSQSAFDSSVRPIEPRLVKIPAGRFIMGSPADEKGRYDDEGPQHVVNVAAFSLADAELTFGEWDRCVQAKACREVSDSGWGRGQRPVINVSWNDAKTYIGWLNQALGLTGASAYRLPSEAEWEYAARAGTKTSYFWGNAKQCDFANGDDATAKCRDGFERTATVRSFKPNAWLLYDTAGNVWEWVEDCWHADYNQAPADGSAWLDRGKGECEMRSIRGGSWDSIPPNLRSAYRPGIWPGEADSLQGFRLARTN